jgi:hypothetical protein
VIQHLQAGLDSLNFVRTPKALAWVALLTAGIWGLAFLNIELILQAVRIGAPLAASLLILVALQAGISLPSLPGKVGVFEYVCVLSLAAYGVDRSIGLSYGILLHAVVYLPTLALGLVAVWSFK